jgi:hypothetical protein
MLAHRSRTRITLFGAGFAVDRAQRAERRLFARPPRECRPRSAIGVGLGYRGVSTVATAREAAFGHELGPAASG